MCSQVSGTGVYSCRNQGPWQGRCHCGPDSTTTPIILRGRWQAKDSGTHYGKPSSHYFPWINKNCVHEEKSAHSLLNQSSNSHSFDPTLRRSLFSIPQALRFINQAFYSTQLPRTWSRSPFYLISWDSTDHFEIPRLRSAGTSQLATIPVAPLYFFTTTDCYCLGLLTLTWPFTFHPTEMLIKDIVEGARKWA